MKIRVAFLAVVLVAIFTVSVSAQGKNAKTPDVIFVEELQAEQRRFGKSDKPF